MLDRSSESERRAVIRKGEEPVDGLLDLITEARNKKRRAVGLLWLILVPALFLALVLVSAGKKVAHSDPKTPAPEVFSRYANSRKTVEVFLKLREEGRFQDWEWERNIVPILKVQCESLAEMEGRYPGLPDLYEMGKGDKTPEGKEP